ncbi:AAA family ATPase [Serinibacter arcticus]|uniref:AAA family ATPase n=1 Tax=Serinibacter arcticus TaxID=1655435 RepID=A0A2U1ZXT0_9MICO|nr:ATP-binding protein [Serinibacter arcticus]PWD51798.1 AAA family ATPase [Serinibacter arcticus]
MSDDARPESPALPLSAEQLALLLTSFQKVADAAQAQSQEQDFVGERVMSRVVEHLGVDPRGLPVVTEIIPPLRAVDADVALAHVIEEHGGGVLVGLSGGEQRWHMSLVEMFQNNRWNPFSIGAVDYRKETTGPDSERDVVALGLHLFHVDGVPVAVMQRGVNPQYGAEAKLEVVSPDPGTTRVLLEHVRDAMDRFWVLRGQVVQFSSSPFEQGSGGVTFLPRPAVPADSIVLPDGLLDRVRRHVIGIGERAEELRGLGQHLKRGVLLYGPPGTGKTLTVRHLIGESTATVIILTGPALAAVGLAARTARALAPAIVVLEDCDLVAEERNPQTSSPLLFEVLDSLDGLDADADVTFLLTTNRADVLEPALAQRPGRVDLAVEIPLPDEPARRALLDVYARRLPLSAAVLDEVAREASGTTASFAKELVRRAVLDAAEAGRDVNDDDLRSALAEMTSEAASIGRSILGGADEGR